MQQERAAEVAQQLKSHFLLPFHKLIIASLVPEGTSVNLQDDDTGRRIEREEPDDENDGNALIIMARGLGLRRIVSTVMKIYDAPTNLVILVNATSEEEEGISEELTTLGVRRPGLRTISHEMSIAKRRVTSKLIGSIWFMTDPREQARALSLGRIALHHIAHSHRRHASQAHSDGPHHGASNHACRTVSQESMRPLV